MSPSPQSNLIATPLPGSATESVKVSTEYTRPPAGPDGTVASNGLFLQPGGSVEYNNEEPGAEWLQRLTQAFPKHAWINPEPQGVWQYRQSISIVSQLMNQRMFPLTLAGLEGAMRLLSK